MEISEKHISITSVTDILAICAPIFNETNIRYYYHTRYYKDGSFFSLGTHPEWYKHFYAKEYYPKQYYLKTLPATYYEVLDNYNTDAAQEARQIFGLDGFFAIYEVNNNYTDIYGFATTPDTQNIIDFYFKNLIFLKKFIFFYKDKARSLIYKAASAEHRLILPNFKQNDLTSPFEAKMLSGLYEPKKYYFNYEGCDTFLSNREVDCIKHMLCGKTAKETAQMMEISYRTVETHLSNVKNRFGFTTKAELINLYLQHIQL